MSAGGPAGGGPAPLLGGGGGGAAPLFVGRHLGTPPSMGVGSGLPEGGALQGGVRLSPLLTYVGVAIPPWREESTTARQTKTLKRGISNASRLEECEYVKESGSTFE